MPTTIFKRFILGLALLVAIIPHQAQASFPDKPIKIIIGFPAGGPLDAHIRLLTDRLQSAVGQPIVIDYKAGAPRLRNTFYMSEIVSGSVLDMGECI